MNQYNNNKILDKNTKFVTTAIVNNCTSEQKHLYLYSHKTNSLLGEYEVLSQVLNASHTGLQIYNSTAWSQRQVVGQFPRCHASPRWRRLAAAAAAAVAYGRDNIAKYFIFIISVSIYFYVLYFPYRNN